MFDTISKVGVDHLSFANLQKGMAIGNGSALFQNPVKRGKVFQVLHYREVCFWVQVRLWNI